ncbi:copper resistance system multicopper oxidase [Pyruvatibacter sp.]|uniref:copper resistance system multicopper oxidase n=1 Tax=Pyruvatibacter sp. TaxID=1981328 RepID=UPI0032ECEFAA
MKLRILSIFLAFAITPAFGATYDLEVGPVTLDVSGRDIGGFAINGQVPAPLLRFTEGEDLTINVTNTLAVDTSIHWHGFVLPFEQDGVPGMSFDGIKPGETFTYRFKAPKAGTYWYHSHSGLQEGAGMYGPIIIEPNAREPFRYDRDYVVVLSDWHEDSPMQVFRNLKRSPDHYNGIQRTVGEFFRDASDMGLGGAIDDRLAWGEMRMMPSDISDVQGYTYLMNGMNAGQNWTGLFEPGERVRLRFINASAMTFFDVRIPGLEMTVVQADANNVQPVTVDEFRIAVAETYDVIVRPRDDKAVTIFAETMARDGFARGTLAPRMGMEGEVPELRDPPRLTMADMDHGSMDGMDPAGMDPAGMDHSTMDHAAMGHDMSAMMSGEGDDPFYAPGSGLEPDAANGGKFLSLADLRAQDPLYDERPYDREIKLRLTGNMERYMWSINDKKLSEAEPIRLKYGERVRFTFINETMMAHPMHLHGMWKIVDVGAGKWNPLKHVLTVPPNVTISADVEVDAPGQWAFHCHLMYHMAAGMFRKVIVEGGPDNTAMIDPELEKLWGMANADAAAKAHH